MRSRPLLKLWKAVLIGPAGPHVRLQPQAFLNAMVPTPRTTSVEGILGLVPQRPSIVPALGPLPGRPVHLAHGPGSALAVKAVLASLACSPDSVTSEPPLRSSPPQRPTQVR
jgi:hypothetical protein